MNTVLHIGAIQALFLALLILSKKGKELPDYILSSWFIVIAINIFGQHWVMDHKVGPSWLYGLNFSLYFLHCPFFYFYVKALAKDYIKISTLKHSIPFLISVICILFFEFRGYKSQLREFSFLQSGTFSDIQYLLPLLLSLFIFFLVPVYVILIFRHLKSYENMILQEYSSIEDINLNWIRRCNYGLGIIWLVYIASWLGENVFHFLYQSGNFSATFYVITILIFYLGYYGFRQTGIFTDIPVNENKEPETKQEVNTTKLQDEQYDEYMDKILVFMEREKPYLNSVITIKELAKMLNMPVNTLSKVINQGLNKNFFDFINRYRVEEFKKEVIEKKNANLTLLAIAHDCGFNSKSSFNQIFKNHTGKTPTEYLKEVQKNQHT